MADSNIGFIGLGAMGMPMARRLVEAGYRLTVFDADAGRTKDAAASLGAGAASGPGELAAASDVIVTMLPSSAIVRQVMEAGGAFSPA